jgi:hypothetical protein
MDLYYAETLRKSELQQSRNEQPLTPITAQLIGSHRCESLGIVATGHAPVLNLCRSLLAAGLNPDQALHVYRNGTLALRVKSLRTGARLTVKEPDRGRAHFSKWMAFAASPVASPMRKNGAGVS